MSDERDKFADVEAAALRFLGRRDYSSGELREKLQRKGFAEHVIEDVLHTLIESGWIDDQKFATSQAEILVRKQWGPLQISHRLRKHGVDEVLAAETVDGLDVDWEEVCRSRLHTKFDEADELERSEKEKAFRHLEYRGFPGSVIRRVLFD